jgi:chromosome segregation ATPase
MADEQIIVDIRVKSEDVAEAKNKINQLTDSIEALGNQITSAKKQNEDYKAQQRDLIKLYNDNKISVEKYDKEIDKLNTEISANNKLIAESKIQLSAENNQRNANLKLINSELGAYTQLSTKYSIASKNAKDLGVQFGTNSIQFKEAAMAANNLQNELKQIDDAVGQNTRNVGNYEEALVPVTKQLRALLAEMSRMKAEGNDNSAAYQEMAMKAGQLKDSIDDARA